MSFFFSGLNCDDDVDVGKDMFQYIESSDDDEQGCTDSSDSDIYIISDCEGTNMHTQIVYITSIKIDFCKYECQDERFIDLSLLDCLIIFNINSTKYIMTKAKHKDL